MRERLEDFFFVGLSLLFFVSGAVLTLSLNKRHMELHAENKALRHHLSVLCSYIDSLPKRYRAVYEVCLEQEQENTERR